MSTDLESIPTKLDNPLMLLSRMIDKGHDPDKLSKMMDLVERWQANQAAKEWAEAITRFQSLMPAVDKANPVFGKNRELGPQYYFADFASIMRVAQPHLQECGIAVTFDSLSVQAGLQVTCRVRVGTHVEPTTFTLPMPTIPNANASQIAGAALSYAKRYAFTAALNIRVEGEDKDGQGLDDGLTDQQVVELNTLLDECRDAGNPVNSEAFWHYLGVTGMNDLPASKFELAKFELTRKRKATKK